MFGFGHKKSGCTFPFVFNQMSAEKGLYLLFVRASPQHFAWPSTNWHFSWNKASCKWLRAWRPVNVGAMPWLHSHTHLVSTPAVALFAQDVFALTGWPTRRCIWRETIPRWRRRRVLINLEVIVQRENFWLRLSAVAVPESTHFHRQNVSSRQHVY